MPISPLPTPPSTSDPANFDTRADAFLGALLDFQAQANALEVNVNAKEASTAQAVADAMAAGLADAATNAAATAADRVQTGLDRVAAAADAQRAEAAAAGAEAIVGLPLPTLADVGKALVVKPGPELGYGVAGASGYQEFTTSQAWPKPADAEYFWVEIVPAAGSGAIQRLTTGSPVVSGGSSGVALRELLRGADLPASINVVVGIGGAAVSSSAATAQIAGNDGGDSSFHTRVAPGGKGGVATTGTVFLELGSLICIPSTDSSGSKALSLECGAMGARGSTQRGGDSLYGGAGGGTGGAGAVSSQGGVSKHAGNGGDGAASNVSGASITAGSGQFPGGGGGGACQYSNPTGAGTTTSGAGANGRVRVWWW
ncbi:glycine-rich domain-containing protein [Xenophilus sp. Marseille-Q4582]|uniref:glycine-rich domain-containing protein n=1 Tax=Xenophilus sp. Marseille-Q4582 TaxID=2866600 RepID=UPI001CE3BFBE|nr:hypothetical protein [Xenophilus sp. Marseille-Q4582]